jgi:DnaJ-class molecular chaperone
VPHVERKGRGNLVAVVQVSVPTTLNPAQREAVAQLAAAFGEDT